MEQLNTIDALVQLSFAVQRVLVEVGAEHDLSVVQLRLLGVLRDRTPEMLQVGAHLGLDKSSVTGLVGRAEKRGLVRRSPSPRDGRAVEVALTEEGRRLVATCGQEVERRVVELTRELDAADVARLTRLAGAVVRSNSEPPPSRH